MEEIFIRYGASKTAYSYEQGGGIAQRAQGPSKPLRQHYSFWHWGIASGGLGWVVASVVCLILHGLFMYSLYCEYLGHPRQRSDPLLYWPRALRLICRLLAVGSISTPVVT